MALPKLNETPMYELTIPSTGQKARYRPYLVKEEKVLMMAFESGEVKNALNAVVDTIASCLEEGHDIDLDKLTTFDVEYLFTQVRSKSVGETSTFYAVCENPDCKNKTEVTIDLEEITVDAETNNMVNIKEDVIIEMEYPTYKQVISRQIENIENDPEAVMDIICDCIVAVHMKEERINTKDYSKEEVKQFISSMTTGQFTKVVGFLKDIPVMSYDLSFTCSNCGQDQTIELRGMNDFFQFAFRTTT